MIVNLQACTAVVIALGFQPLSFSTFTLNIDTLSIALVELTLAAILDERHPIYSVSFCFD